MKKLRVMRTTAFLSPFLLCGSFCLTGPPLTELKQFTDHLLASILRLEFWFLLIMSKYTTMGKRSDLKINLFLKDLFFW